MMEKDPFSLLKPGTLLIAGPEISSGFFFRSVVLLCEHSPAGSFGLILNKTLDFELPEELLDIRTGANPHIETRISGPAEPNQLMLLHNSSQPDQSLKVCDNVFLGGDLEFLQSSLLDIRGPSILLCFGYSGWGPGQLEQDFMNGAWILSDANERYVFNTPIEKLWRQTLQDKGGQYATLSLIPEDLSLN